MEHEIDLQEQKIVLYNSKMIRTVSLLDEILNILFPLLNYFKFQIESVSNIKICDIKLEKNTIVTMILVNYSKKKYDKIEIKIDRELMKNIKNYITIYNLSEDNRLFNWFKEDILIEKIEKKYNLQKDSTYSEIKNKKIVKTLKNMKKLKYVYDKYINKKGEN